MTGEEAAAILRSLADAREARIGDLESMGWDEKRLVESSGDLEFIEALRLGAEALDDR